MVSAGQLALPTMPSALRPREDWKFFTAVCVAVSKLPFTVRV